MNNLIANTSNHVLFRNDFPLSSKYDPEWIFENQMGPNALWLLERLLDDLDLKPGMRVLDMGCGKALTSIFLAHEFDVMVWANDLWIEATDNWKRIKQAGMENKVFPVYAEAHSLPYAEGFFDCIISIDSYQYYGTDEMYIGYFHKFVKRGGQIGLVMPGVFNELNGNIPEHFTRKQKNGKIFWDWDCRVFHTAEWWRKQWSLLDFIKVEKTEEFMDGGHLWLDWERALDTFEGDKMFQSDIEALEKDNNSTVTFIKMVGKRTTK